MSETGARPHDEPERRPLEPRPTKGRLRRIAAFIRAGCFPHIAAEATGLPFELFRRWMHLGGLPGAPPAFRCFRRAVRRALAEARLTVEVELRKSKPLDWLRCGPGRPGVLGDGWTLPAKAPAATEVPDVLAQPAVQELVARILVALEPYPELRDALARSLDDPSPPASVPGAEPTS